MQQQNKIKTFVKEFTLTSYESILEKLIKKTTEFQDSGNEIVAIQVDSYNPMFNFVGKETTVVMIWYKKASKNSPKQPPIKYKFDEYSTTKHKEITQEISPFLNKKQIIEWLETQSQIQFKSTPLSEREYAKQLSAIKEKMWRIRYRCQSL